MIITLVLLCYLHITKYLSSKSQFRAPVNDFLAIALHEVFTTNSSDGTLGDEHSVFEPIQSIDDLSPSSNIRGGLLVFLEKVEHELGSDLEQRLLKYRVGESGKVDSFDLPLRTFVILHSLLEPDPKVLAFFDARFHHLAQLEPQVVKGSTKRVLTQLTLMYWSY